MSARGDDLAGNKRIANVSGLDRTVPKGRVVQMDVAASGGNETRFGEGFDGRKASCETRNAKYIKCNSVDGETEDSDV